MRIIKKITAIGFGALLLGSTLSGVVAQELGNYPEPFVKNGQLDNTVLVVGEGAAVDFIGAIDIATALQTYATTTQTVLVTAASPPKVTEGLKIEKSGNRFNYNDDINDIFPESLDYTDLPIVLSKEKFKDTKGTNKKDIDYTQEIQFMDGAGQFVLAQPKQSDGGNYFKLPKGATYKYTLEFNQPVSYSTSSITSDLEGNSIKIQGNTYTISTARGTNGVLDELELTRGDAIVWLKEDEYYMFGDSTVAVLDVNNQGTMCGVNVDGVTRWIRVGSSEKFGDFSVKVLDAITVRSRTYDRDQCELSLGKKEIELNDGENIYVNGDLLEGSEVTFLGTAGKWEGIEIEYSIGRADTGVNKEAIFLAKGDVWFDPVFGNWKIIYEGTYANYENMKFKSSGKDAEFTYTNVDGRAVSIPYYYTGSQIILGSDTDEPLLLPGEEYDDNPEGTLLLYTTPGGETHILEIEDITCKATGSKISVKDVTYGNMVARGRELKNNCLGAETISLGSLGSISLDISEDSIVYESTYGTGVPKSKYNAVLNFADSEITITEKKGSEKQKSVVELNLGWDSGDKTIILSSITDDGLSFNWVDSEYKDDDVRLAVTEKGTMLKYDAQDKEWVEISAPENDVYANVFITPMSASIIEGQSTRITTTQINPIKLGLAVTDNEAQTINKNMIVVGGPCVNKVAADLMGNRADCTSRFANGKAKIKFFNRNGNWALLVAGYSAQDTKAAAYALVNYKDYVMSGDEVEIVASNLNDIKVNII